MRKTVAMIRSALPENRGSRDAAKPVRRGLSLNPTALLREGATLQISIITAVLNRVATIADAVGSVQSQSYADVEHIIQDGGSTDGTLKVLERFAGQSTRIYSEKDRGIYDALNRGISKATGDIIGLMHSDDLFSNRYVLENIAKAFGDPNISGVYGDLQYVAADDATRVVRHWTSGAYHPAKLRMGWMPPHPTLYLRRDVFERWGVYDASFRIAADYEAILRYLVKGNIQLFYIPEVLVKMRLGGESNRSFAQILRKTIEDLRAIRRHKVGGMNTVIIKNLRKIGQFL